MRPSWIIITDGYINSWSFVQTLRGLGWEGRVAVLRRSGPDASLMELAGAGVELWTIDFTEPEGVLPFLKRRIPEGDAKAIFFTEESLLPAVHRSLGDPWLRNAHVYPREACALETILDRPKFYAFIERERLAGVPRTVESTQDPLQTFPNGFFIRFKRSWNGLQRLPRPRLAENRAEFETERASLLKGGHTEDQWCYQEKLSIDPKDNVSICGWHDAQDPSYLGTRKALQYPARQGGGAIVEVIHPPSGLFETTRRLLDALKYEGPFELEFVLDLQSGTYKVIELNPRLWMQHALHGAHTGETIARRYLGLPAASAPPELAPPVYWINGIVAVNRMLSGSWDIWRFVLTKRRIVSPDWGTTLRWLPRFLPNLVRRSLHGWRR